MAHDGEVHGVVKYQMGHQHDSKDSVRVWRQDFEGLQLVMGILRSGVYMLGLEGNGSLWHSTNSHPYP